MTKRLEIGKLYRCPRYHLFVWSSSETASSAAASTAAAMRAEADACSWSNYWSNAFDCTVRYGKSNAIFMVIEHEEKYGTDFYHVIFKEIQGWFICLNWLKIERVQ